jgi:hypothetical protein
MIGSVCDVSPRRVSLRRDGLYSSLRTNFDLFISFHWRSVSETLLGVQCPSSETQHVLLIILPASTRPPDVSNDNATHVMKSYNESMHGVPIVSCCISHACSAWLTVQPTRGMLLQDEAVYFVTALVPES